MFVLVCTVSAIFVTSRYKVISSVIMVRYSVFAMDWNVRESCWKKHKADEYNIGIGCEFCPQVGYSEKPFAFTAVHF